MESQKSHAGNTRTRCFESHAGEDRRPANMCTEEGFNAMIEEIMAQGYDEETAAEFAALIGDTPCFDEKGNLLVLDHETGKILATLKPLKGMGD